MVGNTCNIQAKNLFGETSGGISFAALFYEAGNMPVSASVIGLANRQLIRLSRTISTLRQIRQCPGLYI